MIFILEIDNANQVKCWGVKDRDDVDAVRREASLGHDEAVPHCYVMKSNDAIAALASGMLYSQHGAAARDALFNEMIKHLPTDVMYPSTGDQLSSLSDIKALAELGTFKEQLSTYTGLPPVPMDAFTGRVWRRESEVGGGELKALADKHGTIVQVVAGDQSFPCWIDENQIRPGLWEITPQAAADYVAQCRHALDAVSDN